MWKFEIELCLPKAQTGVGQDGSLPERLNYESLVGSYAQSVTMGEVSYQFGEWSTERESYCPKDTWPLVYESILLIATLNASNFNEALSQVSDGLEKICDQLTFFVQNPVAPTSVLVCTPEGKKTLHPTDRLLRSSMNKPINQGAELGADSRWLSIDICKDTQDGKIDEALRWYRKAILETHRVDRFIYLWISLEILCGRAGNRVSKPYVAICGCTIETCPHCNSSTEKPVFGDTIKSFLTDVIGIDESTAKKLWKVRQVVHGQSISINLEKEFDYLSSRLYGAVTAGLRKSLGLNPQEKPLPPKNMMYGGGWFARSIK